MIKKIEKPNIDIKFNVASFEEYYFDEETKEYFIQNKYNLSKLYFNLNGEFHRIGKPAYISSNSIQFYENDKLHRIDGPTWTLYLSKIKYYFYINDIRYGKIEFAKKTNHLICKNCDGFCKQQCFP